MSFMSRAKESTFKFLPNGNLSVENAVIIWTNFSGAPTKFNPAGGKRTFSLVVPENIADELRVRGWNVKQRPPRDPEDDDLLTTEIVVNMNSKYPPKIFLCSEFAGKRTMRKLSEETVGELDQADIMNVDIDIHPYEHNRGPFTVKGYCDTLYATTRPVNDFGGKYAAYMTEVDGSEEDTPW